uniref:Retrotransposon protein, putative, unclassified n=1 Tax=Oryza sativa subsp. japonica TaxID=39947 RepID=Q338T1_ORYSJ|nr:retrotransposon protein, putative, unclassified [Oryza sativa Japonica Group]
MVDKKHDIDDENIIPVMLDKLTEEQKATLEQMMNQLQNQYLHSFTLTRHGTVQYRPRGSPQPQYLPQYNQLHQMQQQLGGTPRQQPWVDMIANVMREQFGLKPKDGGNLYWHPYPEYFERVPLPNRYKVPDFSKFSGQDNVSTYEHVSRFSVQCGEASANDALKVRLFPLILSGSTFTWFSSLPNNSIQSWADLEKQFHKYFYSGVHEMKLSDLTAIRQKPKESVLDYIQ